MGVAIARSHFPGEPQPGNALGTSGRGGSLLKSPTGPHGYGCKVSRERASPVPTARAAESVTDGRSRTPGRGQVRLWEGQIGTFGLNIQPGAASGRAAAGWVVETPSSPSAAPRAGPGGQDPPAARGAPGERGWGQVGLHTVWQRLSTHREPSTGGGQWGLAPGKGEFPPGGAGAVGREYRGCVHLRVQLRVLVPLSVRGRRGRGERRVGTAAGAKRPTSPILPVPPTSAQPRHSRASTPAPRHGDDVPVPRAGPGGAWWGCARWPCRCRESVWEQEPRCPDDGLRVVVGNR